MPPPHHAGPPGAPDRRRRAIETCFREGQLLPGPGSREGRSRQGRHRHMALCMLLHFFLLRGRLVLKKKQPGPTPCQVAEVLDAVPALFRSLRWDGRALPAAVQDRLQGHAARNAAASLDSRCSDGHGDVAAVMDPGVDEGMAARARRALGGGLGQAPVEGLFQDVADQPTADGGFHHDDRLDRDLGAGPDLVEGGLAGVRGQGLGDRAAVVVVEDGREGGPAGVGGQAPAAGMGDRPGRVDLVLLVEVPGEGRVGNSAAPQADPVGADLVVGVEQGAAGQAGPADEGRGRQRRQGAADPAQWLFHESSPWRPVHAGRRARRPLSKNAAEFQAVGSRTGRQGPVRPGAPATGPAAAGVLGFGFPVRRTATHCRSGGVSVPRRCQAGAGDGSGFGGPINKVCCAGAVRQCGDGSWRRGDSIRTGREAASSGRAGVFPVRPVSRRGREPAVRAGGIAHAGFQGAGAGLRPGCGCLQVHYAVRHGTRRPARRRGRVLASIRGIMRFWQFAVRIRTESRLALGEGPEGAFGRLAAVGRGVRLGEVRAGWPAWSRREAVVSAGGVGDRCGGSSAWVARDAVAGGLRTGFRAGAGVAPRREAEAGGGGRGTLSQRRPPGNYGGNRGFWGLGGWGNPAWDCRVGVVGFRVGRVCEGDSDGPGEGGIGLGLREAPWDCRLCTGGRLAGNRVP